MRLFVALALPSAVRSELAAAQQRLRRTTAPPVKWVAPTAMHLTLHFLGEAPDEQVPELLTALRAVHMATASHAEASLHLTPVGAFPNVQRPQTIWMGVGGDVTALAQMQQAVVAALEPLGFPAEARPFRAHLTLGRVRREATPAQRAQIGQAIAALPPPPHALWQCGVPILFQSTLTPNGAIYRELGPD